MRYIEDLRNKYEGKEIWVIGCGASLDDYPDDFFDDKISIAMNWSFIRFPNVTHCLFCHDIFPSLIRQLRPDLVDKCILSLTDQRYEGITWYEDYLFHKPLWAKWDSWCRVETKEAFQEMADKIMRGEKTPLKSLKTTAHNAVDAAVILGAKKITLVGCEVKMNKYQRHAQRGGMWFFYKEPHPRAEIKKGEEYPLEWQKNGIPGSHGDESWRRGFKFLAEVFKPYGIEIMRYDYKRGYEEIN